MCVHVHIHVLNVMTNLETVPFFYLIVNLVKVKVKQSNYRPVQACNWIALPLPFYLGVGISSGYSLPTCMLKIMFMRVAFSTHLILLVVILMMRKKLLYWYEFIEPQ